MQIGNPETLVMKRKRSGYAKKSSVNRQDQKKAQPTGNVAEANGSGTTESNCNGLCSIHWKPGTVAK
jgi:hypothetical protein